MKDIVNGNFLLLSSISNLLSGFFNYLFAKMYMMSLSLYVINIYEIVN